MNDDAELLGRVAVSLAGRDKGRAFFITGLSGEYALLSDGSLRTLGRPKKKKRKHLRLTPALDQEIQKAIREGAPLQDAALRKSLNALGYRLEQQSEEG